MSNEELRSVAREIFDAGVRAALPDDTVRGSLSISDDKLRIALSDGSFREGDWSKVHIVSIGKAAVTMARTLAEVLPASIFPGPGIIVTND